MASLSDVRDAAVADYAAKLAAFRSAYVELAALDRVLASYGNARQGFGPPPDLITLRHAFAAPGFGGNLADDIRASVEQKLAAFPNP
jgi:hypothetical protein